MLTTQERSLFSLKILERFKPALKRTWSTGEALATDFMGRGSNDSLNPQEPQEALAGRNAPASTSLEQSNLVQMDDLPPYTLVLGICEDGVPFVLDLTNPAPGSILIVGDEDSEKIALLESILTSANALNPTDQVLQTRISLARNDNPAARPFNPALEEISLGDPKIPEKILALAELADQRRHGYQHGAVQILAIDDFAGLLQSLDSEVFSRLFWLIKHGPRSRVWVITALESNQADTIDERVLGGFRTRLVGQIEDPFLASYLSADERTPSNMLESSQEFCALFGEEWMKFYINTSGI